MAADTTTLGANLKKFYLPRWRNQINNKCKLLTQIAANDEHVEGDEWVLDLHIRRNSGTGARAENDSSPAAGQQGHVQARDKVKEIRGRIQITERIIRAAASNKGSFVRAVDSEMDGAETDAKRNQNRQLAGTGNGVIAICGVTAASTTIVLDAATPRSALRQLEIGFHVDIGQVATPTSRAADRIIQSVNVAAKTFVVSGANVTTDGNDRVFIQGAGGVGVETHGLQEIVAATGDLFNVAVATYPEFTSFVKDAAGAPVSDLLFDEPMDEVDLRSGEEIDLWLMSYDVFRQYGSYLSTQKRSNDTLTLKGGHKALSMTSGGDTVGAMRERDIPDRKAFGLSTSHLFAPTMSDWDFMDRDGNVLSRVQDKTAYEGTLVKFVDLATDQRNAHCLVDNIAV